MNTFRRIESLYRENGYKTHYGEPSLLFRDCCYDDFDFIISKIKKVDEDTTIELNVPYAEPCLRPHLLFENQEDVANSFLKNNGYSES